MATIWVTPGVSETYAPADVHDPAFDAALRREHKPMFQPSCHQTARDLRNSVKATLGRRRPRRDESIQQPSSSAHSGTLSEPALILLW
jgi:hypothetical protein